MQRSGFAARFLVTCLLLPWAFGASVLAQEIPPVALAPAAGVYADAISEARQIILDRMEEVGIPGFSVAVGIDGDIVWAEGFGYADLENRVPVWPETKFRIASISKAVTAGAIGHLVEAGLLDLDAPVQRYVPSFPEKSHTITTRLLGGHLAGIRHYRGQEMLGLKHYDDVIDGLEIFRDDDLISVPGEEYHYSSYGWNLISAVIQGASGTPYLEYMNEVVFGPLRLRNTVAEHLDSLIYHRARFYERNRDDGVLMNAPHTDNSYKWAGGGFLSTASDLVRYGSAYLGGEYLRPETIHEFWTSQRTTSGEVTNYGIGWRTEVVEGERWVGHTGGATGGSTILLMLPDKGTAVAILTNVSSVRHVETAFQLADLFAGVEG
jgi:CubicO group peptidase (beta-lactamase class C family)